MRPPGLRCLCSHARPKARAAGLDSRLERSALCMYLFLSLSPQRGAGSLLLGGWICFGFILQLPSSCQGWLSNQDRLTVLCRPCRWLGALLGRSRLVSAMHGSSCPPLYHAYSPVLTYFPAPKGLVSQDRVTTGSYLHDLTQVKVEVHLGERAFVNASGPRKHFPSVST